MVRTALTVVTSVVALMALLVLYGLFQPGTTPRSLPGISYSAFVKDVAADRVQAVTIQGPVLTVQMDDGHVVQTYMPEDAGLVGRLIDKGVGIVAKPVDDTPGALHYVLSWLPLILITGIWWWGFRRIARSCAAIAAALPRAQPVTPWPPA